MKLPFFWAVLLLPLTIYGQDTTIVKDRWFFIGLNFSPDYCYATFTRNNAALPSYQWTSIKSDFDKTFIPKYSYTAGVNFDFSINKQLSIETGIQYSNKGFKTIPLMTLYDWGKPPAQATHVLNFIYTDIPLKVNYSFHKKRLQLVGSFGIVLNIFRYSSDKIILEKPTPSFKEREDRNTYKFGKINFSPMVSLGIKYNINPKVNFRVEPTFRYQLFNIDNKSEVLTRLWNIGLNIGLYFGR